MLVFSTAMAIQAEYSEVKVKCRKCGKPAYATQFTMDTNLKMMVCPACYKESNAPLKKEDLQPRPAGWDKDDESLQKARTGKEIAFGTPKFEKIDYSCIKCKHKFMYDPARRHPNLCPFCGSRIYMDKTHTKVYRI